ncbi:MAG: hypothetical protein M3P06_05910 [Acidobacteriota bacterium]|nr:hypothetical protein [Acidobacteriota bacterium]
MPYDPSDPAKMARQRLVSLAIEEIWILFEREFHTPTNAHKNSYAAGIAMAIDSHVKTGLEQAAEVASKAWPDIRKTLF